MIALAICALIAFLCSGFIGLFALLAVLIAAVLWLRWLNYRLGGYTGDGLGAVEQIAQVVTLLCLAAAWN
jgi:adenosylcobinamide-GDP ribazoletransferase